MQQIRQQRAGGSLAMAGVLVVLSGAGLVGQDAKKWGRLTEVQVSKQAEATAVAAKVTGEIDIRHGRLENPARIFIDFAETTPAIPGQRGMVTIAAGTKLLKQVRVAENQKGLTRLVFDLATDEVDYQTIAEREAHRLVVVLRPRGAKGKLKNPLREAAPPPVVSKVRPPVLIQGPMMRATPIPDPPVLRAAVSLPRAEAGQMPYRVSGYVLRDFIAMPPVLPKPGEQRLEARKPEVAAVAARSMAAGRQSLTRVLGLKIGKVVIDPGHGGHDVGSSGPTGLLEKDVTLDIAKRLASLVEESLGSEVVLTRTEDVYISPEQRTALANLHKADLFISIHVNSSRTRTATGVETYYLNFTASPEALEVAARENASSQQSISDLSDLVKKITLKDKLDESREFAAKVQTALFAGSTRAGNRTKDRGVRKAPFIVLIGARMPSILTEVGFLSNAREEGLLKKPEYRQKIAEALLKGVQQYTDGLSHFSVAQTVGN